MKSGKTMLVALALGGMVISGPAAAMSGNGYVPKLDSSCSEVVKKFEAANLTSEGREVKYHPDFGNIIGWIAGYMTGVNYVVRGKADYYKATADEVAWVASWCRDNQSKDLSDAMAIRTFKRLRKKRR